MSAFPRIVTGSIPRPVRRTPDPSEADTSPGWSAPIGPLAIRSRIPFVPAAGNVGLLAALEESAEATVARYLLSKGEAACVDLAIAMASLEGP